MPSILADTALRTAPAVEPPRRRRIRAADEAVLTLSKPIANWQAKFAWGCAAWGLIPGAGLPLGLIGMAFGGIGLRRVRRNPEDLGIRHALGGLMLGGIEILVNLVGLGCIVSGVLQILHSA